MDQQREAERDWLRRRLEKLGISKRVTSAVIGVSRDCFVPKGMVRYAWRDVSLPIGHNQTISQPSLVGHMIDLLRTSSDHHVLDVGTGSGYQAAILSRLVRRVTTVERVESLYQTASARLEEPGYSNVSVRLAGDELGWPCDAPYDGIIVGAASPRIPSSLVDQLKIGGRLVIPVGSRDIQHVFTVRKTPTGTEENRHEEVRFVPLIGDEAW